MSKTVSNCNFLSLLSNTVPVSNSVNAGGGDVSAIARDTFSSSEHSACSIWAKTGVEECTGAMGASV